MADSAADCEAMVAKAREKNVLLGVNHSDLFDPMIRKALDLVEEGRIGKVLAVDILRSSDYPAYSGGPLPKLVTQGSYPFRDLRSAEHTSEPQSLLRNSYAVYCLTKN